MAKRKRTELDKVKQNYVLTVFAVYMGFFLVSFFIVSIFLTIFQAHPYVLLAAAIMLMLAGILFADRVVNHTMKDRFIIK
ncbi:MAG: hypothetical protein IJ120_03630 [Solobacterium sp.]|nr:hypothetical protein [Solobacterium sp.]